MVWHQQWSLIVQAAAMGELFEAGQFGRGVTIIMAQLLELNFFDLREKFLKFFIKVARVRDHLILIRCLTYIIIVTKIMGALYNFWVDDFYLGPTNQYLVIGGRLYFVAHVS